MRRREFIAGLGSAVAWPFAARAQQPAMPVIGYLSSRLSGESALLVAAFRRGLRETGYIEGRNVAIEYRWAEGQYDRLPELAADLVRRQVTVIASTGGIPSALAAKAATTTIPIVFQSGVDPVESGLVASPNRPGGNLTGASSLAAQLAPKQLEVLHQAVPAATIIAALLNPTNSNARFLSSDLSAAARTLAVQLHILHASTEREIDIAFATLVQLRADALLVGPDPFPLDRRAQLVALSALHALPALYANPEFPPAGGLMSYGGNFTDSHRQVGVYVGRILKGEKPADLPVLQSTKVELVINLKTAKALGLTIPETLLATADEVIQ